MRQLVQLAAAEARNAAHGQIPLTPSEICRAASRGELPGQQALLFAFGKVDHPDAGVRDAMRNTCSVGMPMDARLRTAPSR